VWNRSLGNKIVLFLHKSVCPYKLLAPKILRAFRDRGPNLISAAMEAPRNGIVSSVYFSDPPLLSETFLFMSQVASRNFAFRLGSASPTTLQSVQLFCFRVPGGQCGGSLSGASVLTSGSICTRHSSEYSTTHSWFYSRSSVNTRWEQEVLKHAIPLNPLKQFRYSRSHFPAFEVTRSSYNIFTIISSLTTWCPVT